MKRLLSIIGAISLLGTSTTSLVACKDKIHEYTPEELKELKEKNKIDTKNKEIRDNLEWIAPQERPFNTVDNKYYYVVFRSNKDSYNWQIKKIENTEQNKNEILFTDEVGIKYPVRILSSDNYDSNYLRNYFKSVYRWNLDTKQPDLIIDDKGNVKVNGE